jgi:hypothetical protein
MDRPVRVDLRELFRQIPHQTCITRDDVLAKRDQINEVLRTKLDEVTEC